MSRIVTHKIYTPISIRNRAQDYAGRPTPTKIDPKRKGAVIGKLSELVTHCLNLYEDNKGERIKLSSGDKDKIDHVSRLICAWLFCDVDSRFETKSRTELTPQQVNALGRWMSRVKRDGDRLIYNIRPMVMDEMSWIIFWARQAEKWTENDQILFKDILQRYRNESITKPDGDDHWMLHSFSDYVEMKYNEMQSPPDPEIYSDAIEDQEQDLTSRSESVPDDAAEDFYFSGLFDD